MKPTAENELLTGARKLDQDALTEIYCLFSPGIYRYAMRLLGDDCLAEDCVSETFSRFLKAIEKGSGPQDHLQAYLYRIAHNMITDSYRRQPLAPVALEETVPERDEVLPEFQANRRSQRKAVLEALKRLTPEQQQVLVLRFVEAWDHQEVAAALCKPAGAIRALQHRALKALRVALAREEIDLQ
jgi:RNA polymerase sigma-70 factor (ECF subfamily)